jgi:hypothetical protein
MTPIGIRVHALLDAARKPGVNVPPRLIKGLEGLALAVDVFVFLRRAATLLQVLHLNADRVQLDPATVDLSALVRSTVERHRPWRTLSAWNSGSRLLTRSSACSQVERVWLYLRERWLSHRVLAAGYEAVLDAAWNALLAEPGRLRSCAP